MLLATLAVPQAIQPIDLTALLATFMGISIVLIPVLGITAQRLSASPDGPAQLARPGLEE